MADLLQSWFDKNAVGSDYLPKLAAMGMNLRNDAARIEMQKQQLQNQYAQFQAETARTNQQAQFQDRKFQYSIQQDQMQQARQNMLDIRAGKMQDAQMQNWKSDNERAAGDAEFNKSYRSAQMDKWKKDSEEDAPANFDWITGETPTGGAPPTVGDDSTLPPDGAATGAPPQNFGSGGEAGLPSWGEGGGVTGELVSPAPDGPPRAVPVAEAYVGAEGAPGEPGASGAPSDPLATHPGRAKWEAVQRGSVLTPGMIAGMKSADRTAALRAMGQVATLKQDPDVIDYERRVRANAEASNMAFQQDQADKGQEEGFANDARTAGRQLKALDHYAGADLPFNSENARSSKAYSPEMKNLRKGIPAKDWQSVATAEENAMLDDEVGRDLDWRNGLAEDRKRNDTSIEARVGKATARADVKSAADAKGLDAIQNQWAKENGFALKVIEDAAIAAKSGGQAPTETEILKRLEAAFKEQGGERKNSTNLLGFTTAEDWADGKTNFVHPDPDQRGMSWKNKDGKALTNKDMAMAIYDRMKAVSDNTGLAKPSSPEEALSLPKGTRYVDPNGKIRTRQ